ncbi:MAG: flavodoxin-dependent (E)-4-hydroxy-3-methylbut-2-enyl-diphosphate synthase [Deltaproteobacteria bacterium]|nr:flavodoxin-dependent (E)-4-hydroxy-3-methylbut-2-enyl-diphosphate synthase [Deltaproteobacteria bacterium]
MTNALRIKPRPTRKIKIGDHYIGADEPILIQSMCATKTQDIDATVQQVEQLYRAGAGLIRLAVDSKKDVEALAQIRRQTKANLVIDLQENYQLIEDVAPYVQKVRYNPGHLYHTQTEVAVKDKVKFIVKIARDFDLALRIGVNFGSLDPNNKEKENPWQSALTTTYEHCDYMEGMGFERYCISLKSSDPQAVVTLNREFAKNYLHVPVHLGVTEAGMLPDAEIKSRMAFEPLLTEGIGDTLRVSITIANEQKDQEVVVAEKIIADVIAGRLTDFSKYNFAGLNVISCPSCSRVENHVFVKLAQEVRTALSFAQNEKLTIAVMGCRVNGPGETDHADLGLWCAPKFVNLKRGSNLIGQFAYDEVIPKLVEEVKNFLRAT